MAAALVADWQSRSMRPCTSPAKPAMSRRRPRWVAHSRVGLTRVTRFSTPRDELSRGLLPRPFLLRPGCGKVVGFLGGFPHKNISMRLVLARSALGARRRGLLKVATAYLVVTWLVLEIGHTLFVVFDLPHAALQFIFVL